jgi:hypothetical protein
MDYTKATKAEIIELLSQKEFEFQETLKEKDKEIAIKSDQLEKEKIRNSRLVSQLDSNVHQKSIDELNEVIKQLREESFEKQRLISKLNSDKENKEYELNQRITSFAGFVNFFFRAQAIINGCFIQRANPFRARN